MISDGPDGGPLMSVDVSGDCRVKVSVSLGGGSVLLLKNIQRESKQEQLEAILVIKNCRNL